MLSLIAAESLLVLQYLSRLQRACYDTRERLTISMTTRKSHICVLLWGATVLYLETISRDIEIEVITWREYMATTKQRLSMRVNYSQFRRRILSTKTRALWRHAGEGHQALPGLSRESRQSLSLANLSTQVKILRLLSSMRSNGYLWSNSD